MPALVSSGETFRILMLHGYAQSREAFKVKGRLLMQHISQALLPQITEEYAGGIEFIFPDAPISLNEVLADEQDHHSGVNHRAWWLNLHNTSRYIGLEDTIVTLVQSLGGRPVHAAVGFSQGGAFAAMIASLCEATHNPGKRRVLEAQGLPMNLFLENIPGQRPLKFVICISAYRGTMKYYSSLYSQSLSTRSFHIIGTLDTVVEELESEVLATAFEQPNIFRHFGTHYIPRDPVFFRHLDGFLEDACDSSLDADADTKIRQLSSPCLVALKPAARSPSYSRTQYVMEKRTRIRCVGEGGGI